jgi:hypothetical protein
MTEPSANSVQRGRAMASQCRAIFTSSKQTLALAHYEESLATALDIYIDIIKQTADSSAHGVYLA